MNWQFGVAMTSTMYNYTFVDSVPASDATEDQLFHKVTLTQT